MIDWQNGENAKENLIGEKLEIVMKKSCKPQHVNQLTTWVLTIGRNFAAVSPAVHANGGSYK